MSVQSAVNVKLLCTICCECAICCVQSAVSAICCVQSAVSVQSAECKNLL